MAKDPAFLFYPGDWLSGTMYLTHEQKGAYMDLLILQFNCGKFNEAQAKQVLSICFDVAWPMLKQKFVKEGDLYFNTRLQSEIEKRKSFTESRRKNAQGVKSPKTDDLKPKAYPKHMLQHMEDENINENLDIKELNENQKKLLTDILSFFKYDGINFKKQQSTVFSFVYSLPHHKKLDFALIQIPAYIQLKTMDSYPHGFDKFIGTQSNQFNDGLWDDNWVEKLKSYKEKNGIPTSLPKKETTLQKHARRLQERQNENK